jgi:cyanophycinase
MRLTSRATLLAAFVTVVVSGCASRPTSAVTTATPVGAAISRSVVRGSLVIVGGGPRSEEVMQRFLALAGGAGKARILVLPMASSLAETGPSSAESWRRMGATSWSVNLTREQALDPAVVRGIDSATGIWFPGGDQSRITAVLVGTPAAAAIRARYAAGAVVGGTSAGAAVLSTPMITGDEKHPGGTRPDTTQSFITIARDNIVSTEGLGLAQGIIVDQHFLRRKRHNRLISLVLEHPSLIGVGLDESTALVVEPGKPWQILGASAAVVYDARQATVTPSSATVLGASGIRMHVLPSGAVFDPATGAANIEGPGHRAQGPGKD